MIIEKIDFEKIAEMLSEKPAPKGIVTNLEHLLIAKESGLTVLTGDNKLKDRFSAYYENVISYIDLRKLTSETSS